MSQLYDGPILDSHMHLWDLAADRYPWLRPSSDLGGGGRFDSLKKNYLLDDYRHDIADQPVVASVHIEALWDADDDPVNETRWLDTLDKHDDLATRYVAACRLGRPDTEMTLRRQAEFDRVAGIRQVLAYSAEPSRSMVNVPELARDAGWRDGVALMAELGLVLELLIYPEQAEDVAALAHDLPNLTIVVDHVAGPIDLWPDGRAAWRAGLAALAGQPNVLVKISSVQGQLTDPTTQATTEVVHEVLSHVGPARVMVGSDFPVGGRRFNFAQVFDQYRAALAHLRSDEQFAAFCGTAAAIYNIDLDTLDVSTSPIA